MLLRMLSVLALIPGVLSAEEWTPVTEDAAIVDALGGRTVRYDVLTFQFFDASGSTQFITERASDRRWAARGGQYCSIWPPSDIWTCYDFQAKGDQVRFISSDQSVSVGTYEK